MTIARLTNWHEALCERIAEDRRRPFAWGEHDCVLWAANVVLAMTGQDLATRYRGRYRNALGASRLIKRLGGMDAILCAVLGHPIAPLYARAGDVGIVENAGADVIAVCVGMDWIAPTASGLGTVPFTAARSAWRV